MFPYYRLYCFLIQKFAWAVYIDMIKWHLKWLTRRFHLINSYMCHISYAKSNLASYQNTQRQLWVILLTDWRDLIGDILHGHFTGLGLGVLLPARKRRGSREDVYTISKYQINGYFLGDDYQWNTLHRKRLFGKGVWRRSVAPFTNMV